ncbi:hypothetical protein [Saccharolobus islandicus]|uniref:Uncharacterized protein n=3 Tax=Saccharolobus islandicus TaxID=43080 RepID=M9UDX6_SACIS|nr:hypothetical protein [Sulfolobus islandicus]ADX82750.1 conserved plasmid protein [Sulfolobus islandicus HVE10/4]ADX85390.1 conserved plasmid protein [Sulfolobus islandicus REY15A]AGJ62761.1 Hypothetical Protein SiL_1312 [Sulfolobus islandicus LAL14/1]
MPETIRIVRKYYAIDENRNIVAEGNSWEEVEEIMKKKGYKRSQYDILTVVEAEKN